MVHTAGQKNTEYAYLASGNNRKAKDLFQEKYLSIDP